MIDGEATPEAIVTGVQELARGRSPVTAGASMEWSDIAPKVMAFLRRDGLVGDAVTPSRKLP